MSYSLNSSRGSYIGVYMGDYGHTALQGFRDTTPIMEKQMDKTIENEVETGIG